MLRHRLHSLATVAAIAALALTAAAGPASAASNAGGSQGHAAKVVKKQKRSSARQAPGGGTIRPPASTTAVAISAFPTGGKGSGSEATCGLWSEQLQADVENLGDAESVDDRVEASNDLQQHKDDAMDAGCVVID
jgi:hypothetical protein